MDEPVEAQTITKQYREDETMSKHKWRPLPGFEGIEVSDDWELRGARSKSF